jgi:hypothetical protein
MQKNCLSHLHLWYSRSKKGPSIVSIVKSFKIRWAGPLDKFGKVRNTYLIFVGNTVKMITLKAGKKMRV